jgi:hypothetical protein
MTRAASKVPDRRGVTPVSGSDACCENDPVTERTIQLRRYRIHPEMFDDFVEWMRSDLLPMRVDYGFHIEFAYADPANSLFTWAVSLPGDEAGFREFEEHYTASPERAAAFEGQPQRVAESWITFVSPVA